MELKISSPTSSIMKSFSPTASPLSSPLSSPTKSSKAKKTISFLLPDSKHEEPVSPAAGKGDNDAKEKLEAIQKKKEEDEAVQNGKEVKDKDKREEKEGCDEVRTEKEEDATEKEEKEPKLMSVEKRQRRVYEYPDLKTSAAGYRCFFGNTLSLVALKIAYLYFVMCMRAVLSDGWPPSYVVCLC